MATVAPASAAPRRIAAQRVAAAAVFLATLATFSAARTHQFIAFDDDVYVSRNPVVARGLTAGGIRWAFTTFEAANWHPLTWLSHMLDVQLFGLDPGGHHLTSVLIHALGAALLFRALWGMTSAPGRSAAVAALFALHPLRAESVAWVAERKDVLSGLFFMLTLLAYLRWARQPRIGRYLAVVAALALGLLCKPMLVTAPFVLLLLDFWPLGRLRLPSVRRRGPLAPAGLPLVRLLVEKTPLLALAAASSAVTLIAQEGGGAMRPQHFSLSARLLNAVHSYVAYLGKAVWPSGLMIFYPRAEPVSAPGEALGALSLLAAVTLVAVLAARSRPSLLTGWLWYLGSLVPVIGIVHAGAQAQADRYTYLPLIGIFIAVAWLLPDLPRPSRRAATALAAGAAAVCVLFGILAARQSRTMRDSETLFRHMLSVDPDNELALYKMGAILVGQGRTEEGAALMRRAYRGSPLQLSRVHLEMAGRLAAAGKTGEAMLHYGKVLELDPGNPEVLRAIARLKAVPGGTTGGVPSPPASGTLAGEPEADAWFNQGNALVAAGHVELAVDYFRRAAELKPDFADAWNNLGSCLGQLGRHREAAEAFEKAAAAAPEDARIRSNLERARRLARR